MPLQLVCYDCGLEITACGYDFVWLVFDCVGYAFARLFGWLLFSGCLLRLRLIVSVLWVVC